MDKFMEDILKQIDTDISTTLRNANKELLVKRYPQLASKSMDRIKSESDEALVSLLRGCAIAYYKSKDEEDALNLELLTDEIMRRMKGTQPKGDNHGII